MSWTKRQLVEEAFAELALAGYAFDLQPEELQAGLRRLDTMIATWEGHGITLGYPIPSNPSSSDLDQASGLPDRAVEAVYTNLAVRIAAGKGKALPQQTVLNARRTFAALFPATPPETSARSIPIGTGVRRYGFVGPTFTAETTTDPLDFLE